MTNFRSFIDSLKYRKFGRVTIDKIAIGRKIFEYLTDRGIAYTEYNIHDVIEDVSYDVATACDSCVDDEIIERALEGNRL